MVSTWWLFVVFCGSAALFTLIGVYFLDRAYAAARRHADAMHQIGVKAGAEGAAFAALRADLEKRFKAKMPSAFPPAAKNTETN